MKLSLEMSPEEWVMEREVLRSHIDELLDSPPGLAKSAGGPGSAAIPIQHKPHPSKAIGEMSVFLRDAYDDMVHELNKDVLAYIREQVDGKVAPH